MISDAGEPKQSPNPEEAAADGRLLRFIAWSERALSKRRTGRWILVLSVLLGLDSVNTGLAADDHIHSLILHGSHAIRGWHRATLDLFRFADGNPVHNQELINQGLFPWWADLHVKLAFFRPLTAITHWLDYRLWPHEPWLMHLQSLAWFALLIGLALVAYRRLVQPHWVATLAFLLFALDDSRAPVLAWVANRNAITASVGAVAALVLHDKWRRDGSRAAALLAPLAFGVGLLAGEATVSILGYLFAYALFLDRGRPASAGSPARSDGDGPSGSVARDLLYRALTLLPYGLILIAWRVMYLKLGYGVSGSGLYLDPMHTPLEYLHGAVVRIPVLWLATWGLPWSELWSLVPYVAPGVQPVLTVLAFVFLAGTIVVVAPMFRRDPRVRFWVVGTIVALLPPAATFPADRLLTLVSFGAMPLLALVVEKAVDRLRAPRSRGSRRRAAALIYAVIVVDVVFACIAFPSRCRGIIAVRQSIARSNHSTPATPDVRNHTVIYVNPPGDPFAAYIPIVRADEGTPRAKRQRWLAPGLHAVHVTRLGPRTLRVRPDKGFLQSTMGRMLRGSERPMHLGQTVDTTGMKARITAMTPDGRPAEAVFTFDRPLEDPSYIWLKWTDEAWKPFHLPAVGQSVVLPAANFVRAGFGPPLKPSERAAGWRSAQQPVR